MHQGTARSCGTTTSRAATRRSNFYRSSRSRLLFAEGPDIGDEVVNLAVLEPRAPRLHVFAETGRGAAVLDHVEHRIVGNLVHGGTIGEIARIGRKRRRGRTVALATRAVTLHTKRIVILLGGSQVPRARRRKRACDDCARAKA